MTTNVQLTADWMLNSVGWKRYSLLKTQTWNRGSLWDGNRIFAPLCRVEMSVKSSQTKEQSSRNGSKYDTGEMNGAFGRLTDQTIELQTAEKVEWIICPIGRAD